MDYTKAFDRIEHNELMYFLDDLSLYDKDLRDYRHCTINNMQQYESTLSLAKWLQ